MPTKSQLQKVAQYAARRKAASAYKKGASAACQAIDEVSGTLLERALELQGCLVETVSTEELPPQLHLGALLSSPDAQVRELAQAILSLRELHGRLGPAPRVDRGLESSWVH